MAIASTGRLPPDDENGHPFHASHLCGHTVCKTVGHVIWESAEDNQRRKNCLVWVDCGHDKDCDMKVHACIHSPRCLKYIPGVDEHERLEYFH